MRLFTLALGAILAAAPAGVAYAADPAPAAEAAPKYTTADSQLGTLMADPAAKAVLLKHIPDMVSKPDILERASGMTLREINDAIKAYSPDALNEKKLAAIDADLAKLH